MTGRFYHAAGKLTSFPRSSSHKFRYKGVARSICTGIGAARRKISSNWSLQGATPWKACYNGAGLVLRVLGRCAVDEPAVAQAAQATQRVARAASLMAVATLLSRFLGLLREVATAAFFGATSAKGAFVIGYNIPFFIQRLLLSGTLSIVFIPTLSEYLARGDDEEVNRVSTTVFNLVLLLGVLMVAVGTVAAPLLVTLSAPGFRWTDPGLIPLAIRLTRIMFGAMFFLALSGFAMGYLHAHQHFTAPALAPLVFNVVIIAGIFLLAPVLGIAGLAVSFLLGWALQFVVQVPAALRQGFRWSPRVELRHPAVREMARLSLPAMLGLAVVETNAYVDRFFASFLPATPQVNYVAVLDYAYQVVQAPVSIFGISIATAVFPTLARHASLGDRGALREANSLGIRMVLFATIPLTALFLASSQPMVRLIFERGAFAPESTAAVASAVVGYAVGLSAIASYYIVTRTFYAQHDMATPVKVGAAMIALNALLDVALMRILGHAGIALATSLVAATNVGTLLWLLRRRLGSIDGGRIGRALGKMALASLALGVTAFSLLRGMEEVVGRGGFLGQLIQLSLAGAGGVLVYLAACALLRVEEAGIVLGILRRRVPVR